MPARDIELTDCNDLDADGETTVYDAVMLNACRREEMDLPHPGGDAVDFCSFPALIIDNPADTAWFSVGKIDLTEQYVDIYVRSPLVYLLGYQFKLHGVNITSISSLISDPNYAANIRYDSDGTIAVLSADEDMVPRYLKPTGILRVYCSGPDGWRSICKQHQHGGEQQLRKGDGCLRSVHRRHR